MEKPSLSTPPLVFPEDHNQIVVNFGMYSGRDATPAEITRLGRSLVEYSDPIEVVSEHRFEFGENAEALVHQLRIHATATDFDLDVAVPRIEAWARECIHDRQQTVGSA